MDEADYQAEIVALRDENRKQRLKIDELERMIDIYRARNRNVSEQVRRAIDLNKIGDHVQVAVRLNTIELMACSPVKLPEEDPDVP